MIAIKSETVVKATLVKAEEKNIPHYGLVSNALYQIEGNPFKYKITWWNKHAPVTTLACIVSAKVAEDAPLIVLDNYGKPLRDENGKVKVTRNITVLVPITTFEEDSEGNIIPIFKQSPYEVIQRYLNKYTLPTVWGDREDLVQK